MGHLRLLLKLRQNLLPTCAKSPAVTTKSALKAQVNGDGNFIDDTKATGHIGEIKETLHTILFDINVPAVCAIDQILFDMQDFWKVS